MTIAASTFVIAAKKAEDEFKKQIDSIAPALIKATNSEQDIIEKYVKNLYLPLVTTRSAEEFYSHFDPFIHPETNEPVPKLAAHQIVCWDDMFRYIYRMYPKSQKITLSSLFLLEDIYHALTDSLGMEILIIGQSKEHAKIHLQDFRKMVLGSDYKDYLIQKPILEIGLLEDEVSKVETAYMHNPKNFLRPTKIYALGPTPGALISFKRVKHIHASDITKSKETPDTLKETVAAMISRLANSVGSTVIEAPPRGLSGPMYEEFEKYQKIIKQGVKLEKLTRHQQRKYPFFVKQYDFHYGMKAGVMTEEFIEGERNRWGPLFPMLYEASFYESDQSWYTPEMFKTSEDATDFFSKIQL